MNLGKILSNRSIGYYIDFIAFILTIIAIAVFMIITNASNTFDGTVLMVMILSLLTNGAYLFIDKSITDIGIVLAVVFMTVGLIKHIVNSIGILADQLNGISMFGSTGSVESVIITLSIMLAVIVLAIASSFTRRGQKV